MVLSGAASFFLIFFVVLFALISVVLLGVTAFALTKVTKFLDMATEKLEPIVVKTSDTLDTVQRITMTVGEKTDHILTRSETLTDNVSDRVEKTANVVQSAVTRPLINLSSLITGVSKGVSVWSHAAKNGATNGKAHSFSENDEN